MGNTPFSGVCGRVVVRVARCVVYGGVGSGSGGL